MKDGEKQRRTSIEDCRKRYEEKRKQEGGTFRQEWHSFGCNSINNKIMFCSVCREFPTLADKHSSLFKGSQIIM